LRLFENRVLRRIFGTKREEVAGGWRRLHNEDLHNLYSSPDIIRCSDGGDEMDGACSTQRRYEKCTRNFDREPEGKRPLEDRGVEGKIILERILRKLCGNLWTGCI
jgi:hypothetical protein